MNVRLETERLVLRPYEVKDAEALERYAGDIEVARTTMGIPHPYPEGGAVSFIEARIEALKEGKSYSFAIVDKQDDSFMGAIGIHKERYNKAQLGYWIGKPFWGYGYMTEAVNRAIQFGFDELKLNRIYAGAMTKNPASSKVMDKAGMKYEGTMRQEVMKWDQYEDIAYYGLLREEYVPS